MLYSNGYSNLANTVVANFFSGVIATNSNAQPNITSLGNLTGLQIGNTGAGNEGNASIYGNINVVSTDTANANLGHVWAPWIGNANSNFAGNVANFTEVIVTANANIEKLNVIGNALITKDLTVTGNVYVQGTTNYVNVENLNVEDPIISLGGIANGGAANTDANLGLWLRSSVSDRFIGWRTANSGEFVVASNASVTGNNVTVNTLANIVANNFIGTIQGTANGLANGNSNVAVANAGNITMAVAGNANVVTVTGTGANVTGTATITGNLTAANAALGNLATANNFTGNLINGTSNVVVAANGNVSISSTAVANVLVVTGTGANITGTANITGNTTSGNFVGVFANGSQSNVNIPTADGNIEFSAAGATTYKVTGTGANVIGNLDVSGNLTAGNLVGPLTTLGGNSSVVVAANADVTITSKSNAVLIVSDYSANVTGNLNVSDTLSTANFTITGDFGVGNSSAGSATLTANNANFNLINTVATKVNFAGAASNINMGATTGTLTINNPTIVGSQTTQSLFNTVATTINLGGAATALNMGATTGTTTISSPTIVGANTTQSLFNTTATTINFGGAATTLNMGATTGTTTISSPTIVGASTTQNLFNTTATTINLGGAADINLSVSGKTTNVAGNLTVTGSANLTGTTTISADANLFIGGGDANGQYLKLANFSNGLSQWANVNWSDLGTNDATRGPAGIALGKSSANSTDAVYIGENAGTNGGKIAIGKNAGTATLPGSQSIELNGYGNTLTPNGSVAASGFYVRPVRALASGDGTNYVSSLRYDTATGEIVSTNEGAATATYATSAGTLALNNSNSNVSFAGANGAVSIYATGTNTVVVTNTTATINGNLTVTGSNLFANSANIKSDTITANTLSGNGSGITYINASNVSANVTSAITANYANFAGTIVTATQGNITSAANLVTVGNVTTGTWSADIGVTSGANLSAVNIANITDALTFTGPVTNNGVALDAANVGTIQVTINGTTYTLYAVPQ